MPAPICLIVNPSAGGGRAARIAPEVERALRAARALGRAPCTRRDLDHARELAREAAAAGETVAALSGDGLVGVLADELRGSPGAVLGVLPGGRGNDLARVLEIPTDPGQACRVLAAGTARPLDLGLVEPLGGGPARAFVGIASVGFDSDANRIANEAPAVARRPRLRLRRAARAALLAPCALRARARRRRAPLLQRLLGRGRQLARLRRRHVRSPRRDARRRSARRRSRSNGTSRLRFLANLPRVFKGTHVELPNVPRLPLRRRSPSPPTGRSRCTPTATRSARCRSA